MKSIFLCISIDIDVVCFVDDKNTTSEYKSSYLAHHIQEENRRRHAPSTPNPIGVSSDAVSSGDWKSEYALSQAETMKHMADDKGAVAGTPSGLASSAHRSKAPICFAWGNNGGADVGLASGGEQESEYRHSYHEWPLSASVGFSFEYAV